MGALARAERTITVDVGGRRPAPSRPAASACAGGILVPAAANRVRVVAAAICLVNAERRKLGRRMLRRSPRLALAAVNHSKDMVRRGYFEHEGPGGPLFETRLRRVGYRGLTSAENISYSLGDTVALTVRAWMASSGHRSNILRAKLRSPGSASSSGYRRPDS